MDGNGSKTDRPTKSAFRTLTQSDLVERADPRSDHNSILQATIGWLGNPSSQNVMGKPSSGTRTMASLLERTDRDSESLHLVHLPQGGINRAQAAVGLAYMNSILRSVYNTSTEAPVGADSGIFQDLSGLFEPSKKTEGGTLRITPKDIPNKIQFTLRHKKNDKRKGRKPDEYRLDVDLSELFAGDAKSDQQKATAQYRRSNLTRVNKQDSLMYIAKAMNDLQHVLENQLGRPALQQRMDRAARSSGSFPSLFSEGIDAPHVHELLYLAMDAATSPLRLIDVSYTSVGDTQEAQQQVAIDGLLRCSMARLFALGTRLEALARVLVECPLKDPYQSASVLLLDQIRVLLKFHHTDWLEARASHATPPAGHRFSQTVADNLNRFKNERRQRLFHGLECNELTDAEARTEPSTSYIIEYGLAEREDQKHLIERSKSRLEFDGEDDLSKAWGLYFHSARNLYKEIYAEMDNDDPTLPKQEDGAPSTKRDPSQDERKIHQAMNYLKENTQREWILWARLAMFPPCFVGRSLLSGTTTKDLNTNLTPNDNSRTSIAKEMLFGTVKDAVMDLGD